ncbi:MAG: RluA family pseudouridine synthase [Candidatus Rokubacteria bacterium]|nr:RluA family pseudouridine synthase [Candidatus Rokubacteria bacterium]
MRALRFVVDDGARPRLDRWLAGQVPDLSRARLQALIADGRVRVGGTPRKMSHRLVAGDVVDVEIPPPPAEELAPEAIALSVIHEDDDVLVVDKPAGMVVHPGAGHPSGTLAAAVLAHAPGTAGVGGPRRPGIVHRLDKDTSGLLVLAKTAAAYDALTAQLAARTVTRRYVAVVHGRMKKDAGVVDAPIGRDPRHRQRMAVVAAGKGKRAVTRWRVAERFAHHTAVEVSLETGRTHQIRVHLASLGHPVVGDDVYGGRVAKTGVAAGPDVGYALHAERLAFLHPMTRQRMEFSAPLPPRLQALLSRLRHTGKAG